MKRYVLLVFLISLLSRSIGQTSLFYPQILSFSEIPSIKLSERVVDSLLSEKQGNESKLNTRFAVSVPFEINSDNDGVWTKRAQGGWVWYCKIYSKNAQSLRADIDQLRLAKGGRLSLFNAPATQIETVTNNPIVSPINGDMMLLELFDPNEERSSQLVIKNVAHGFSDFMNVASEMRGTSESCNININCAEGGDWQKEKYAVCLILFSTNNSCTGTLINNTAKDETPYILTANHCLEPGTDISKAIFYFNYEKETCNATAATKNVDTIKGGLLIAAPPAKELDFVLLKPSRAPLKRVSPYLAGWDISGTQPTQAICLHHPKGDVTKISATYKDSVTTGSFLFAPYLKNDVHWHVHKWEKGTTEPISSGAALFNQSSHLIIGSLSGGDAKCSNSIDDYFAKFSVCWDYFPEPKNQLKAWLDPLNTGATSCAGMAMTVFGSVPTSISSPPFDEDYRVVVAPNPILRSEELMITLGVAGKRMIDERDISIIDLLGNTFPVTGQMGANNTIRMDVSFFAAGVYRLAIKVDARMVYRTLIIQ